MANVRPTGKYNSDQPVFGQRFAQAINSDTRQHFHQHNMANNSPNADRLAGIFGRVNTLSDTSPDYQWERARALTEEHVQDKNYLINPNACQEEGLRDETAATLFEK